MFEKSVQLALLIMSSSTKFRSFSLLITQQTDDTGYSAWATSRFGMENLYPARIYRYFLTGYGFLLKFTDLAAQRTFGEN